MKDLRMGLGKIKMVYLTQQILNHNWRTHTLLKSQMGFRFERKSAFERKVQKQEVHELSMKPVLIYLSDKSGNYNVDRDLLERFLTTKSAQGNCPKIRQTGFF